MEEDEGVESEVLSSTGQQPPHFSDQRSKFWTFQLPWSVHWGQRGPLCGSACWEAREDSLRAEESVEQFLACMDRMACQLNGTELLPSR